MFPKKNIEHATEKKLVRNLTSPRVSKYKADKTAKEEFLLAWRCLAVAIELLPKVMRDYGPCKTNCPIITLSSDDKNQLLNPALHGTTVQRANYMKINGIKDIYPVTTSSTAGTGLYFTPNEIIAKGYSKIQKEASKTTLEKSISGLEGIANLQFNNISQLRIGKIDSDLLVEVYATSHYKAAIFFEDSKSNNTYNELCKRYHLDPNNIDVKNLVQLNLRSEYQRAFFNDYLGYDMITWNNTKESSAICVFYPETIGAKVEKVNVIETIN
ncbi:MAG: hypothetical protein K0S74_1790 [Chlamydiales bacterium]|nr:hypothetical protein [Chlamydiales bacterium]